MRVVEVRIRSTWRGGKDVTRGRLILIPGISRWAAFSYFSPFLRGLDGSLGRIQVFNCRPAFTFPVISISSLPDCGGAVLPALHVLYPLTVYPATRSFVLLCSTYIALRSSVYGSTRFQENNPVLQHTRAPDPKMHMGASM